MGKLIRDIFGWIKDKFLSFKDKMLSLKEKLLSFFDKFFAGNEVLLTLSSKIVNLITNTYFAVLFRIAVFVFASLLLFKFCSRHREDTGAPSDTIFIFNTDTSYIRDTVFIYYPRPVSVLVSDTLIVRDTVLLKEHKFYKDSLYEAWVSGYEPSLDSICVFPVTKTITNTITNTVIETKEVKKKTPFGIGIQAGYGYPHGAYVGIGISYNFIRF